MTRKQDSAKKAVWRSTVRVGSSGTFTFTLGHSRAMMAPRDGIQTGSPSALGKHGDNLPTGHAVSGV
jgi:hypothetical protein